MGHGCIDDRLEEVLDSPCSKYEFETLVNAEKYSGENIYDSVNFVVHPGWTAKNYEKDWEDADRKDFFLQEFYSDYIYGLEEVFQNSDARNPVHIIYSQGGRSHAETIVEQLGGAEVVGYSGSKVDSGELNESSLEEVLQTVDRMHPGGGVKVHGEIKGRCASVFLREIEENTLPDTDIGFGVTFPPEPTWNYAFIEES